MWAEWEAEAKSASPGVPTSVPMTRQDNELYVRVPARMRLDYFQTDKRTNRASLTQLSDKKVTDEKIASAIGKIGNGLDKFGSETVNGEEIAMAAVASSSANPLLAGGDVTSSMRDLKHLMPNDDDEDEDEDDDDDDEPAAATGAEVKPKEKGKWWPRDAFVIKKETEMEGMLQKDEKALKEQHELLLKDVQVVCARLLVGRL